MPRSFSQQDYSFSKFWNTQQLRVAALTLDASYTYSDNLFLAEVAQTLTIPANLSEADWPLGSQCTLIPIGTAGVTVAVAGGVTINGGSSSQSLGTTAYGGVFILKRIAPNDYLLLTGIAASAVSTLVTLNTQTGTTYTTTADDNGKLVIMSNASANTLTLAIPSTTPTVQIGSVIRVMQGDTGATLIEADSGGTLNTPFGVADGGVFFPGFHLFNRYSTATFICVSSTEWAMLDFMQAAITDNVLYLTPTTGFFETIGRETKQVILQPAGTLATGQLVVPDDGTGALDGQTVEVMTTQAITAFTFQTQAANSVNIPTTLAAGDFFAARYVLSTNTWYRRF